MAKGCQDSCLYLDPAAPPLLGSDSKLWFFTSSLSPLLSAAGLFLLLLGKEPATSFSLVCLSKEESGICLVLACYFDSTSLPFALLGSVSTSGLGQKKVENGQFAPKKKKLNLLLSAKCCVTLHQEGQRIHSQDTGEFWPQCWAGLGILLIPNNLCCCSVRKTSPGHGVGPTKHSSFPQNATAQGPHTRMASVWRSGPSAHLDFRI